MSSLTSKEVNLKIILLEVREIEKEEKEEENLIISETID